MTIFAAKTVSGREFGLVQETVGELQMQLGGPYDLMMLMTMPPAREPLTCDIYIGLPDERLLAPFPGFRRIDRKDIPTGLIALVTADDGFAQSFPDIDAKIGY